VNPLSAKDGVEKLEGHDDLVAGESIDHDALIVTRPRPGVHSGLSRSAA
jgi:hypothetical protein